MPIPDHYRRGACPSAGNPMASGDGLLSRVRLVDGRMTPTGLRRVAALADEHGDRGNRSEDAGGTPRATNSAVKAQ